MSAELDLLAALPRNRQRDAEAFAAFVGFFFDAAVAAKHVD